MGDAARDLKLPDHTGSPVRLSSSWADGPALVLLWRYQCCEDSSDLQVLMAAIRFGGAPWS